jgi:hypothetical protein
LTRSTLTGFAPGTAGGVSVCTCAASGTESATVIENANQPESFILVVKVSSVLP